MNDLRHVLRHGGELTVTRDEVGTSTTIRIVSRGRTGALTISDADAAVPLPGNTVLFRMREMLDAVVGSVRDEAR